MHAPAVGMLKSRIDGVAGNFVNQRERFAGWHAFYALTFALADVEALAPGVRMRARDWMNDGRLLTPQGLIFLSGAGACAAPRHLMNRAQIRDAVLRFRRQGIVGGKQITAYRLKAASMRLNSASDSGCVRSTP